ncbi:Caspase domain-containing protein [Spirulina subsalsa]|uniref:Caspase domain-containing protein n=1 Tax=Spirulina subsalsa TaxID=54311 RepID=UPI0002D80E0B|nr:Caspase domain-containing protein [Spirulina subsalsa]
MVSVLQSVVGSVLGLLLGGSPLLESDPLWTKLDSFCQSSSAQPTHFLVMAGGGTRDNTEIALEKNVLYFQRLLAHFGFNPQKADVFFASGNSREATVRFVNGRGQSLFKPPEIPGVRGASTPENLKRWLQDAGRRPFNQPLFFYFTGHGLPNELIFWDDTRVSVQDLAQQLDQLPPEMPVVTMMAQCFAGSFADLIYEGGDSTAAIAPHNRCGFFATVRTRPSVGCSPEVNEADYVDYSSSFFAGLSGKNRLGEAVASADYDRDGRISYQEAHAFAKVDLKTMDLPVSTLEVWLQEQVTPPERSLWLSQPLEAFVDLARPEQEYVILTIADRFGFDIQRSYRQNLNRLPFTRRVSQVDNAFLERLQMEIFNVAKEQQIRVSPHEEAIAFIDHLLNCENQSWEKGRKD